jgi:hypothetical protein
MAWSNPQKRRDYHKQYMRDRRDRLTPIINIADLDGEVWKPIPGYEETYAASSLGRIKRISSCNNRRGPHILSSCLSGPSPYPRVVLAVNRKMKTFTVHSLVAAAFLGPRPARMVINHKDGDQQNPSAENLEYCTQKQNVRHAISTGLFDPAEAARYMHLRKPIIRRLATLLSVEQAAWVYGVSEERIRKALR